MDKLKQSMAASDRTESRWLITTSLVILAGVALAFALAYTRPIMIPFVLALFIVTMVTPIMDFQMLVLRFPRVLAVTITLIIVILIISLMGLLVADVVETVARTAPQYTHVIEGMVLDSYHTFESFRERLEGSKKEAGDKQNAVPEASAKQPDKAERVEEQPFIPYFDERGVLILSDPNAKTFTFEPTESGEPRTLPGPEIDGTPFDSTAGRSAADPNTGYELPQQVPLTGIELIRQAIGQSEQWIKGFILNALGTTLDIVSSIIFVAIFVIFLLSGRDPRSVRQGIYTDIEQKIRRYIMTKVAVSAVTGLLVWFTLDRLRLPLANVFGVLAFLLNFIPSIGSIISTLLPVPIAFAQFRGGQEDLLWLILVILVPGVIQFIIGSLIDPKLMGEGLNLHPVTILLALSFWGLLWGIAGAFLAAPITAAIRIVLMQFDTLKPVGMLLAGELSSEPDDYLPAPVDVIKEKELASNPAD